MPLKAAPNGVATIHVMKYSRTSGTWETIRIIADSPARITAKRVYWRDKFYDRESGKCLSAHFIGEKYRHKLMKWKENAAAPVVMHP